MGKFERDITASADCKELIPGKFNLRLATLQLTSLCTASLGSLYFSTARKQPQATGSTKVLNVDNKYLYEGYNSDFGPLTLNHVHNFVKEVEKSLAQQFKVVYHCQPSFKCEANGAFLIGSFLLICKNWSIA